MTRLVPRQVYRWGIVIKTTKSEGLCPQARADPLATALLLLLLLLPLIMLPPLLLLSWATPPRRGRWYLCVTHGLSYRY